MKNSLLPINDTHNDFWNQHPALLVGLSLVFGVSTWMGSLAWGLYLSWLRRWPLLVLLPLTAFYAWSGSPPDCLEKGSRQATFSIHSLQPHNSPFYKGLLYKGTLYLSEGAVPCSIYYQGENHPPADVDYRVTGVLTPRSESEVGFKPKEWIPIANTWSLAEFRYQMKERLRAFLDKKLPAPRVSLLLSSLLTGDVEDRSLRYEFGRLGLQHILAISGFHFGVLVAFCSFFLGLFLPEKPKVLLLLSAVTLYFLFVGPAPAVQRSWIAAVLYLVGTLIQRNTNGLNLLGVALGIEVLLNPLVYLQIGFQLSFASCGGILLLYSPIEKALRSLLPKRNNFQIMHLSFLSKHAHIAATTLRQSLSLGLAVNLVLLPLLLYHFHQFPLLSLLYNLFFPFLISLALFALLLSFPLPFLFPLTNWFTAQILTLVAYPPLALDSRIAMNNLPSWSIPLYLFIIFCIAINKKDFVLSVNNQNG